MLRKGTLQVLWALLLAYIILLGIALLFGREVGYGISFAVCGGIALLVSISFFSVYMIDRATAWLTWRRQCRRRDS